MSLQQLRDDRLRINLDRYRNLVSKSKPKPGVQTVSLPFEIGRRLF